MDLYQFFSSLVASLAWPTCVLCVILCFRKQLTLWAERLYSLKYKGLEVILSMEAVAKQAEKAGVIPIDNNTVQERNPKQLIESAKSLTEDNPEAAIIIAWQAVELTIVKKFLLGHESAKLHLENPLRDIEKLYSSNLIDEETRNLLQKMRSFRNRAVHPSSVEPLKSRDAKEFIAFSCGVLYKLDKKFYDKTR